MRITDNRYQRERRQFELALRMIRYEARTGTIKRCTGLSDDRIRKLYRTYVSPDGLAPVKRRRGKAPRQPGFFFRSPGLQLEATTLAHLFGLLGVCHALRPSVEFGNRFCDAYELFVLLHGNPRTSFERAWSLLEGLEGNESMTLSRCRRCTVPYLHDALALHRRLCPGCRLKGYSSSSG